MLQIIWRCLWWTQCAEVLTRILDMDSMTAWLMPVPVDLSNN